ncbi:hypothetical protein ACN27F_31750 [Solwaraspora sp. WMMB335]
MPGRPPSCRDGLLVAGASPMNRYVAPLGFTLAAVWIAVIFVLASGTH